jgi:DNA polymerase-3 subunit delta'
VAFAPQIALEFFRGARERERLAHAYLITGAEGSGKRRLAADVVELINGAPAEQVFAGQAPEVYLAGPESKSRRILIEQIRELEHALQMRTSDGRRKVAIVSEADRLQSQAAHAFLKTLEEPPNNSLLLLLSALPQSLPDTILSRCIEISLASPNDRELSPEQAELVDLLNQFDLDAAAGVHSAYRLGQGLQRLLGRIRQTIVEANEAAFKREETRYKNTTDGEWLEKREEHYTALTESLYLQQRASLIELLFRWWGDVLRASTGMTPRELPAARGKTEAVAARLTTPEILRRIRRLEELRDQLGRNIQEALAIEVAFLHLFRFSGRAK